MVKRWFELASKYIQFINQACDSFFYIFEVYCIRENNING